MVLASNALPLEVSTSRARICMCRMTDAEVSGHISDLYSGETRFESRLGHPLHWRKLLVVRLQENVWPVPPTKPLIHCHPNIRQCRELLAASLDRLQAGTDAIQKDAHPWRPLRVKVAAGSERSLKINCALLLRRKHKTTYKCHKVVSAEINLVISLGDIQINENYPRINNQPIVGSSPMLPLDLQRQDHARQHGVIANGGKKVL